MGEGDDSTRGGGEKEGGGVPESGPVQGDDRSVS